MSISYRAHIDDKFQHANIATEEDGTATIEWAPGSTVHYLWFTARKPNFASIHIRWDDDRHPLQLPAVKELRFEPGTTIGGIVRDHAGQPIEGATVSFTHRRPNTRNRTTCSHSGNSRRMPRAVGGWTGRPRDLAGLGCP